MDSLGHNAVSPAAESGTGIMSSIMNFFASPSAKQPSPAQQNEAQRAQYYEQNWKRPARVQTLAAQRSPANVIGNNEAVRALEIRHVESTHAVFNFNADRGSNFAPLSTREHTTSSLTPSPQDSINPKTSSELDRSDSRTIEDPKVKKFRRILEQEHGPELESLKHLAWSGIPSPFRPLVWRLLLGYAPLVPEHRAAGLEGKRAEYRDLLLRHYSSTSSVDVSPEWLDSATPQEKAVLHQIRIDVPRTLPHNKMYRHERAQSALERILFIWALRHPASSYVQGINDLVTPFYSVFIKEQLHLLEQRLSGMPTDLCGAVTLVDINLDAPRCDAASGSETSEVQQTRRNLLLSGASDIDALLACNKRRPEDTDVDIGALSKDELFVAEADAFWCVSKFIGCIQDHYTFAQPDIQRMIAKLSELVRRLDGTPLTMRLMDVVCLVSLCGSLYLAPLAEHLEEQGAQFIQFAFRWMNCLLMREFPLTVVVRLWDTYLAESDQFPVLHTYVCAALLLKFSHEIQARDFQGLMIFLQNMPTQSWLPEGIEPVLSQAFMWMTMYNDSPSHLR